MVWRDDKGKLHRKTPWEDTWEKRMMKCIKEFEQMGINNYKVIFRKNERN